MCGAAELWGETGAGFGPGSHERFIAEVEAGQVEAYARVMEGYRAALAERPEDALLLVECVRFIEYFHYSEELYIEAAEADHTFFSEALEARFAEAPARILYALEQSWGENFDALEERYRRAVLSWSGEDRARFDFLVARRRDWDGKSFLALGPAEASFRRHPTVEAGLLLAELQAGRGEADACRETLGHEVFTGTGAWERSQMLNLYFVIEAVEEARALYAELRENPDYWTNSADAVRFFVLTGDLGAAREELYKVQLNDWNRLEETRRRLEFERQHGDYAAADAAYAVMREGGWETDPFMRRRAELWWQFGQLSLRASDLLGLFILGLCLVGLGLLPAGILMPVHYWGLWRERAGRGPALELGGPGLRALWIVLGVLFLGEFGFMWGFHPEELESFVTDEFVETEADITFGRALAQEAFSLGLLAMMGLFLWRQGRWGLLGSGHLGTRVGIGVGVGAIVGFKLLVAIVAVIWGALRQAGVMQGGAPFTIELMRALYEGGGPLLLVGSVAVLTPVVEELLFRGFMLGAFARYIPFFWANALQSLLFALAHEDWGLIPFYLAFGFAAGWITRAAGGLLPAIVFHALNNLIAAAFLMLGWNA
jgi:uncharacterized protein